MRKWICGVFALFLLCLPVQAAELPAELRDALPEEASRLLSDSWNNGETDLQQGLSGLGRNLGKKLSTVLQERLRSILGVLLAVLLCGTLESMEQGVGAPKGFVTAAGALTVSLLTAGSLESLIGLGEAAMEEMGVLSDALVPTLAFTVAGGGAVHTAAVQEVTTVFFADLLLRLIRSFLLPLVNLYIGLLTAAAILPEKVLRGLSDALRKLISWLLCGLLSLFTLYLSFAGALAASSDRTAVRLAKTAVSGALPVVGSILSDATETVLAGAAALRGSIGVFGALGVLAICAWPVLQLSIQYLLYKLAGFLAGTVGSSELSKLVDGLGGAFGLVLGMTGSCALLLLIAIFSAVTVVMP